MPKKAAVGIVAIFFTITGCSAMHQTVSSALSTVLPAGAANLFTGGGTKDGKPTAAAMQFKRLDTVNGLVGRSPDNSYVLRSIHQSSIKLHLATSLATPTGSYTQVEYTTPYGLLTVLQAFKAPAALQAIARSTESAAVTPQTIPASQYTTVASGTTAHAGEWVVAQLPKSNAYEVHVEFADSTVDASVPSSASISSIRSILEDLY